MVSFVVIVCAHSIRLFFKQEKQLEQRFKDSVVFRENFSIVSFPAKVEVQFPEIKKINAA